MLHDFALNSVHFFCNQSVPICIYILTYTNFGNISGCLLQTTYFVCVILLPFNQGCRESRGPAMVPPPSLILIDQLALYQPEGAIYTHQISTTPSPRIFRPSQGIAVSMTHCIIHQTTCFWGHLPETRLGKPFLFKYLFQKFFKLLGWLYILHLFRHDYFQVPLGNYNLF